MPALPTFYIVKDHKDLYSGKVIPLKILDYIPAGTFDQLLPDNHPFIKTVPVQRKKEMVIQPAIKGLTTFPFIPLSPLSPHSPHSPTQVNITRIPLSTQSPFHSPVHQLAQPLHQSPCSPEYPCGQGYGPGYLTNFGPPIIKLSPMIKQNIPGIVKFILNDRYYVINVPYNYIRKVVNDIYYRRLMHSTIQPKTFVQIITPTVDTKIPMSYNNMLGVIQLMNTQYPSIVYKKGNQTESLQTLLKELDQFYSSLKV